jgi:hypothetical protein
VPRVPRAAFSGQLADHHSGFYCLKQIASALPGADNLSFSALAMIVGDWLN